MKIKHIRMDKLMYKIPSDIDDLLSRYPDIILFDGFDDCIVGVASGINIDARACYSTRKILKKLMDDEEMDYLAALEYFDFNIAGLYAGHNNPIFLDDE